MDGITTPVAAFWPRFFSVILLVTTNTSWASATGGLSSEVPLRFGMALAFVVLLILGLGWLARRSGYLNNEKSAAKLAMIANLRLGNRERVVLLEVEGMQVLVGLSQGRMNTLATLPLAKSTSEKPNTDANTKHNDSEITRTTADIDGFPAIPIASSNTFSASSTVGNS